MTSTENLHAAIDAADARLNEAITAAHAADIELAQSAAHLLALRTREAFPTANLVMLEWSDQGDHLTLAGIADVTGTRLIDDGPEWDAYMDACDGLASNLEGHTEYIWLPYMVQTDQVRNSADPFFLDVAATLREIKAGAR